MRTSLGVEELLLRIVVALVDELNEVHINSKTTGSGIMFQVTVAPTDVGKIIGKNGRTARSIRTLLCRWGSPLRSGMSLTLPPAAEAFLGRQLLGFEPTPHSLERSSIDLLLRRQPFLQPDLGPPSPKNWCSYQHS
jgi:predicted RNA-binding protein YlqC (UPF0109 family)